MNELGDIKLQALLQQMTLDSPKPNFSVRVMNKIFEEDNALERIKSEKILGKGFWIIMILFVALLVAVFLLSNGNSETASTAQSLLPQMNDVSQGYNSLLGKIGTMPLGIAGILAAFSILLFLDRFLTLNSKVFA
jgi:hypothetical protein